MLCDDQGDVVCWVDLGISLDVPVGQRSLRRINVTVKVKRISIQSRIYWW